jgi:hypothetical protein
MFEKESDRDVEQEERAKKFADEDRNQKKQASN